MKDDDTKPIISLTRVSPYIITDLKRFENRYGTPYPVKPVMAICRCGESKNKPFCDGAHEKEGIHWEDQSGSPVYKWRDYVGKNITVHFNMAVCSHDGSCREMLPSVFNLKKLPWVNPDGASPEEIIETIKACPSGALSYSIDGQKYIMRYCGDPMIRASKKGPIEVYGGIELKDDMGAKPEVEENYVLCGCGSSKNKPFCDGEHLKKLENNENR